MRPIKFRAWDTRKKAWGKRVKFTNDIVGIELLPQAVRHMELEQFTGLTDKNGKEIYEGDIVTGHIIAEEERDCWDFEKRPVEVKWVDRVSGFTPFIGANAWRAEYENVEVIGNIHENAELLK